MPKALDEFYLKQEEPNKSCYLALRDIILGIDPHITPEWKYKLPFFYFKGKMLCYLWKDKSTNLPYIGFMKGKFIKHPMLVQEHRKIAKILNINPLEDLPKNDIEEIVKMSFKFIKK